MAMSREQREERLKAYGRLVAKAWADDAFKHQLLADPRAVLQAEGLPPPEGAEVRVLESTPQLVYFSIPPKPAGLSIEELSGISGGWDSVDTSATLFSCGTWP